MSARWIEVLQRKIEKEKKEIEKDSLRGSEAIELRICYYSTDQRRKSNSKMLQLRETSEALSERREELLASK